MPDFADLPLWAIVAVFLGAAAMVWAAGSRLSGQVDAIARKLGLGPAFAGLLLLGGITSLPELATVTTASLSGNAPLAVNNLLGSAAIAMLLLAITDMVYGRAALTSVVANPATLMQGVLGTMLLAAVVLVVTTGDVAVGGTGLGTLAIAAGCAFAMRIVAGFEQRQVWQPADDDVPTEEEAEANEAERHPLPRLVAVTAALAAVVLVAGVTLAKSADAFATRTGLSSGIVGFVLVAGATSLPDLSALIAAARARRYELAVGDVFGTNLFNLMLLAPADALSSGPPVLSAAGTFEAVGALVALLMTGAFTVGFLERRDKTILRMGYDAAVSILIFAGGMTVMARFAS
ncbi:sodium:calcium antiporter [Sphingomonas jatrophae]|uniref:Cation:H+ antiporter n=1 Tax=Sphingomonas jatrophae TaxID=1166337 RepID=A0A1I6JBT0_9SPHN|nr:sodium:calcium symporter [Sphingomonas jatrophae]SFR76457.1 cation:H+ antiporter [Sphingomonas jatrophae]